MRRALVLIVALGTGAVAAAQQADTQYLITARLLTGNPQDTASMELVASPTFRVNADHSASAYLGNGVGDVRLVVTPSELGEGRTTLHVVVESRAGERVQRSTFDVVTGMGLAIPTVAPRDAAGGFLLGKAGQPLFIELNALAPKHRVR